MFVHFTTLCMKGLSDINWYLQFNNDIKFEIIFDNKNTPDQYKSHESHESPLMLDSKQSYYTEKVF